jgi:dTDP-L-rhamnose 4-epimerase
VSDRVLVTGGAGFIGSHLVDELVHRGDEVEVIDNLDTQVHKRKPDYLNPKARYHFADIQADGAIENLLRDVDVVIHLAARVGIGQSMYEIERYVDVNTGGTARLLQALVADRRDVRKLIVASSMSIYGEGAYECPACGPVSPPVRGPNQLSEKKWEVACPNCSTVTESRPTPEAKPLDPNSVYAVTKRDQEELCLTTGRAFGLPTVALRFFNVYGPRQSLDNPYTGVAAIFQSRIKNGQPPVVFEDGRQTRDFVSVHDIVRACLLSMEKDGADYQAVNVGTGRPTSILDVAEVLINLYKSDVVPSVENRFRAGDVRHCVADISKIRGLIGYAPVVSFAEGMRELVSWGRGTSAQDGFQRAYQELQTRGLVGG